MDPNSLSNLADVTCKKIHWAVRVDFEKSKLVATATLDMELSHQASEVHLDTSALDIKAAFVDDAPAQWSLDAAEAPFGQRLRVTLPEGSRAAHTRVSVKVEYSTTETASGVQWLPPAQTADKTHPYVFTQCQAIHARSMIPCQDAPQTKCPYTATVDVPEWATALASAVADGEPTTTAEGLKRFSFTQALPIPTYLIALAVGRLESREISQRVRVWSEPSMVDAAAHEFAQTEDFVATAETLLTPYEWGRYDVLLMPPSFPYGGMENPCTTFVTNSLIAGDRSLADVIAHEIAHSWTGNLVTNKTWSSFFLNEGATMWVQRKVVSRIQAQLHGGSDPEGYARRFFQMDAYLGLKALQDDVELFGADNQLTALVPNLDGVDPDDAFSSVPYEKGFSLLYYLESLVGTPEFEAYMKAYIRHFRMKCVTAHEFRDFFTAHFEGKPGKAAALAGIEWDRWFTEPGMPLVVPDYDTSLLEVCHELADAWAATGAEGRVAADVAEFGTAQRVAFLDRLLAAETPLAVPVLQAMGATYGFAATQNAEIRWRFLTLCLRAGDESVFDAVVAMLKFTGRMKFTRPLYRDLAAIEPAGRALALHTFTEWRSNYHPICAKMVAQDLGVGNSNAVLVPAEPPALGGDIRPSSSSSGAGCKLLLAAGVIAAVAVGVVAWRRSRK